MRRKHHSRSQPAESTQQGEHIQNPTEDHLDPQSDDSTAADAAVEILPGEPSRQALCFHMRLRASLSRRDQRRWYRALRRHLQPHQMVLAQRANFCVALAVGRELLATDRHLIVNWIIDQPETRELHLGDRMDVNRLRAGEADVRFDGDQQPVGEELLASVHLLIRHIVDDARMQVAAVAFNPQGGEIE